MWEHSGFNSRLQAMQIGLGTAGTNSNVLQLDYNYGTANNNGNVQSQSITLPGAAAMTQSYSYDQLNRLLSAQETSVGNPSWQQAFTYLDQNGQNGRYGNRRIDAANTTSELISENPRFDPATNQIQPQAGEQYDYDDAGNLIKDKTGHTLAYDAENKQTIYAGGNPANGGASYSYDGNGQRVKKVSSAGTTIFVYDAMGKLVAEYSDPQPSTGGGTSYLTADNLGTLRVITNAVGNVIGRHDYLPFGEEIATSYGGRSGVAGYSPTDDVKQKFTQKERDIETGLDYSINRYYSATQGRFTSVDPENAGADPSNPQSWNGYAYALNNPLLFIDPDGLDVTVVWNGGSSRNDYRDSEWEAYKKTLQGQGLIVKNGGIYSPVYDDDGNVVGQRQIGTYSSDCAYCEQLVNETARRTAPIPKATLLFGVAGVVGGVTGGTAYYLLTPFMAPTVTTLGLGTTTAAPSSALVSAFSQATLRAFQRQLAQHGRPALEKSLASFEKRLAEHLLKIEQARRAGGYISSMEKEVKIFRESIAAIKHILGK